MKCPICGTTVPAGAERCSDCGYRCQAPSASSHTLPKTEPKQRSGIARFGCCLGVFAAIFLIIGLLGLSAAVFVEFFDSGVVHREPDYPIETVALPDMESTQEIDDGCFSIQDGAVRFLPEEWDGGRVLHIPAAVAGEEVTSLAPGCFQNCEELTTIVLPDTVTEIHHAAFDGCTNLRGLYIPEGCTSIDADAFDGCVSMEAVYIPASMEFIAPGAFDGCAALRLIFYAGEFETWNTIYSDYITPFTAAICLDGSYYHGVG